MYKLLLAWRYLRTRYIALASIISVTLGVATLIVVNSVMAGFTQEMHQRLHAILSDVVVECYNLNGMPDPDWHMHEIRQVAGDQIEGMTAVVHVPAMLTFKHRGRSFNRQVNLIGIDAETYADVSDFRQYLLHPANQQLLTFALHEDGYAPERADFPVSGWKHRRMKAELEQQMEEERRRAEELQAALHGGRAAESAAMPRDPNVITPPADPNSSVMPADPNGAVASATGGTVFDPNHEQHTGLIVGIAVCSVRGRDAETGDVRDYYYLRPGDDVQITFPNASEDQPKAVSDFFTVVDFYESKMSEYDSTFVFVPLDQLQQMRGMIDPLSGVASVTSIQIKLKPGVDLNEVRDKLRERFPAELFPYQIQTWRDMQGPLLAAVRLETTILNILLFLIIAVAGFGILATFFMIVVEKTRDIGILKALGAPSSGVMSIFLSYGVSLGAVGSGVGAVLGLLFVAFINEIASCLELVTGEPVFDPAVYYFQEIPTVVDPLMVVWVAAGAVFIAVMASVLPAVRAARLHPVEALRYE